MASLFRFRRARGPIDLAMDIAGVRLGERLLQAGLGNPKLFAKLAGKAGLSGRACAVVDSGDASALLEAARAYATVGEMCDALRDVWGEYEETPTI